MEKKLDFIKKIQMDNGDCPILHAGDLFTTWKSSHTLVAWAIKHLPKNIITIPGNHELPGHNIALYEKTNLHVLECAGVIDVLKNHSVIHSVISDNSIWICGYAYNNVPKNYIHQLNNIDGPYLLILHEMFLDPGEKKNPHVESWGSIQKFFTELENCKGVISGHNHQSFLIQHNGKFFLSPGSIFRMDADQMEQEPKIWIWDSETNEVESVIIPHDKKVVSRKHLDVVKEKDKRIESFVNRINTDYKIDLSFEKNMERFIQKNKTRKPVSEIIWGSME
jgi:DNA repair exonuclease SbcCD nuclease subunit